MSHTKNREGNSFKNGFALIKDDKIIISNENRVVSMELIKIRKILFLKTRKLHYNFLFLCISIKLLTLIFCFTMSLVLEFFLFFLFLSTSALTFLLKVYQFKFILIKKYDFIELKVSKKYKRDAELLFLFLNKYVMTNNLQS